MKVLAINTVDTQTYLSLHSHIWSMASSEYSFWVKEGLSVVMTKPARFQGHSICNDSGLSTSREEHQSASLKLSKILAPSFCTEICLMKEIKQPLMPKKYEHH